MNPVKSVSITMGGGLVDEPFEAHVGPFGIGRDARGVYWPGGGVPNPDAPVFANQGDFVTDGRTYAWSAHANTQTYDDHIISWVGQSGELKRFRVEVNFYGHTEFQPFVQEVSGPFVFLGLNDTGANYLLDARTGAIALTRIPYPGQSLGDRMTFENNQLAALLVDTTGLSDPHC